MLGRLVQAPATYSPNVIARSCMSRTTDFGDSAVSGELGDTLADVTHTSIVDVTGWEVRFPEPGGSDANVWLRDPSLEQWAAKGLADRFEDGRHQTLVEFAKRAMSLASEGATAYWLDRLARVTEADWRTVIATTPEVSEACRTFCLRLLTTNQRRLLDVG